MCGTLAIYRIIPVLCLQIFQVSLLTLFCVKPNGLLHAADFPTEDRQKSFFSSNSLSRSAELLSVPPSKQTRNRNKEIWELRAVWTILKKQHLIKKITKSWSYQICCDSSLRDCKLFQNNTTPNYYEMLGKSFVSISEGVSFHCLGLLYGAGVGFRRTCHISPFKAL